MTRVHNQMDIWFVHCIWSQQNEANNLGLYNVHRISSQQNEANNLGLCNVHYISSQQKHLRSMNLPSLGLTFPEKRNGNVATYLEALCTSFLTAHQPQYMLIQALVDNHKRSPPSSCDIRPHSRRPTDRPEIMWKAKTSSRCNVISI